MALTTTLLCFRHVSATNWPKGCSHSDSPFWEAEPNAEYSVFHFCDAISELAVLVLVHEGWPEVVPFIFQCVQLGRVNLVESGPLILADISQKDRLDPLKGVMGALSQVLEAYLKHQPGDVKLAASGAICAIVQVGAESRKRIFGRFLLWFRLHSILISLGRIVARSNMLPTKYETRCMRKFAFARPLLRECRQHLFSTF